MACLGTLKGINTSCAGNIGGIQKVFIADFDGVTVTPGYFDGTTVVSMDDANSDIPNTVSAITATSGTNFYTYVLENEVGSATSTLTKGSGGVHYYTQEIGVQFSKMDDQKSLELQAISKGQVAAVVLDNNGEYWYYGADRYLSGDDTVAQSGQGFDDLNGYTSVLRGRSKWMPLSLKGSALTAFEALVIKEPVDVGK